MSYDSSDPDQPQEHFQYDDGVAVQQWTFDSTQHARAVAGNPNIPPSRPASLISFNSIPDLSHRQQGNRDVRYDPNLPRGHWEYVGGETHAGEYAQNFNSSGSSDPSSSSGDGLQMAARPGRGRGRGGTARGGRGGGQDAVTQQWQQQQVPAELRPSNRASERHVQYQDPYMQQQQQQQQQQVVYTQPGIEPPMMPEPAVTTKIFARAWIGAGTGTKTVKEQWIFEQEKA